MSVPTHGEQFAKLLEHLRLAQEDSAMLSHLARAQSNTGKGKAIADGWFAVEELLKRMVYQVTKLAQGKLQ